MWSCSTCATPPPSPPATSRGSVNVGVEGRFAEYAGEVADPGHEIIVVADPDPAAEAKIRLGRIGFDRVVGAPTMWNRRWSPTPRAARRRPG